MTDQKVAVSRIVLAAALAAAVFIVTLVLRIPIPATGGYLNFGDAVIVLTALLFGPTMGMVAGGIGASAADLVGFPAFAIPTLIIKGIMGLIIGSVGRKSPRWWRALVAAILGEFWMVAGYFAVEAKVFKASMGFTAACAELPFNLAQAVFGALIGCLVYELLRRQGMRDGQAQSE